MSSLFDRLAERYAAGHACDSDPVELHSDDRIGLGTINFRPAAVLLAVTDRSEPGVLLLHRPSNMRAHPGQIALPGGKIDPGETPIEAALREAWEELGIATSQVRVVGASDRYQAGSGFDITPVLGIVPAEIEITPNPMEVAQWFEAPLDFLLDPANHKPHWLEFEGRQRKVWEVTWQEHRIWGVTAAIIVNLSRRLRWHA